MSYDISYFSKETHNNPEQRKLVEVSHFMAEGGTIQAEFIDGELVPAMLTECQINVTYNYAPFYYKHLDEELGIRWLYGKTGSEVKERLEKAILPLGIVRNTSPFWQIDTRYTIGQIFEKAQLPISEEKHAEYLKVEDWDVHADKDLLVRAGYLRNGGSYWKPTPGNAGYVLMRILTWIIQNPDGVFDGD